MGATQSHARPNRTEPGRVLFSAPAAGEATALIADRYRLIARLHAGTGGVLYRAEDLAFARPVALRLLTPALSRDEAVLERLQARLKVSASMARDDIEASGDILDLTDIGRAESGQVFIVTELLTGENLATSIARDGPMPWPTLRPLMVRACQILHLSHQHGLLRLDLQTRHLFPVRDKTQTSTLKILSPGIGDVFGDSLWSSLDPVSAARQLRYAAPEQLTGGPVDARTDVYALGVIMYELLCGHVPFPDGRPAYVCARHLLEAPPPFPAPVLATIPREVVGIVHRALAKAPTDRWPTMRALANAMAAIDFGPCDLSGVLEVSAVQPAPRTPSGSSPSMRIDPAAGHAPSPVVLPRTLPPLRDAFIAGPAAATSEKLTTADSRAIDERAQAYERWFQGSPEPSPAAGSSSQMAWDEILAAAEEAVAAVASSSRLGTAGDSGVFTPERLLHSGEAATASMIRGRRPVLTSATIDAQTSPGSAAAPTELVEATAVRATPQLDDLPGLDRAAGDSAADLPVDTRPASGPQPGAPALAAHSAPAWMVDTQPAAPQRSRALGWAAAAILTLGAAAGGLRWLGPGASADPQLAVAAPAASEPARARPQRLSLRPASPAPLAVGSMPAPSQWTDTVDVAAPEAKLVLEAAPTAPSINLSPGTAETPAAVEPALAVPDADEVPLPRPLKRRSAAPAGSSPAQSAASDATRTGEAPAPAAGPRKTLPGTRLPDAGHEVEAAPDEAGAAPGSGAPGSGA